MRGLAEFPLALAVAAAACHRPDPRVERGRYLANGILQCFVCHSPRDESQPGWPPVAGKLGSGGLIWEDGARRLWAPNITPDVETGAGGWSDQVLADAITRGIGHDGRTLSLPMYWRTFAELSDEDVTAVIAYLRTLPPVKNAVPKRALGEEREKELAATAHPPRKKVAPPGPTPAERGRYFLIAADCGGCHTSWEAPVNAGFMAGGNAVDRKNAVVFSANITPSASGIGGWDETTFIAAMRTGQAPRQAIDPIMPWTSFRNLTDEDLTAMFAALRELRPVSHAISNIDPPTECPRCGQKHGLGEKNGPKILAPYKLDEATLAALVGRYRYQDGTELALANESGKIIVHLPGAPPLELTPISPDELDAPFLESPVRLERDAHGSVTRLVGQREAPDIAVRIP